MIDKEKIILIMKALDFEIKDDYTTWTKDNITIHFNDDLVFNPQVSLMVSTSEGDYRIDFTPAELTGIYCVAQILGICKGRSERFEEAEEAIEGCDVVGHISLSDCEDTQEQIKTLTANLDSLAEDYNELLEERNQLHDSYKVVKENLERVVDENNDLRKQNRDIGNQYRRTEQDYQTYRRILNCIMSQFEAREIDW